jgi:hypothetical protein
MRMCSGRENKNMMIMKGRKGLEGIEGGRE